MTAALLSLYINLHPLPSPCFIPNTSLFFSATPVMKWRPWPPLSSRKFEANLGVRSLNGWCAVLDDSEIPSKRCMVEIKWKGSKTVSLRKTENTDHTREVEIADNGVVEWNQKFQNVCNFSPIKDKFHPCEVVLTVINGLQRKLKTKAMVVGNVTIDLTEFAATGQENDICVRLVVPTGSHVPSLSLSLSLVEIRSATQQQHLSFLPRSIECVPLSPPSADAFKAGLRKVRMLTRRSTKRGNHEDSSSESLTDSADDEIDDGEEDASSESLSLGYGTLVTANSAGEGSFSPAAIDDEINFHGKSTSTKCRLLSWRKRKLSFKSSKAREEPLLKKYYGEDGGDDIDFDRRQFVSSSEKYRKKTDGTSSSSSSFSEFGDDSFTVGRWEKKEVTNRDGDLKLETLVFFASIDQRSERAAGEGACTALVAVIANWFLCNRGQMMVQSQFDSLIREGSSEWRKLCDDETYRDEFPDKHFDLETILRSKIWPVTVNSDESFIGFFYPDDGGGDLDFLQGSMSFDEIWKEISRRRKEDDGDREDVFIVSWNDHFFLLKVERDAYYIVDTLGERYSEGCSQAYVIKFDRSSNIRRAIAGEDGIVCSGKESCKEYIKSFLASVIVRELEAEVRKGMRQTGKTTPPLHRRLQVEFHYTRPVEPPTGFVPPPFNITLTEPGGIMPVCAVEA